MDDFLVIGGGIAGLSTAARLSQLGKVRVLEAEDALGYHSSGRSAAMFEESYGKSSTIALNRASWDFLSTADGGLLSPRGLMLLGSKDDPDAFADDMKLMQMQPISADEALAIVPILDTGTLLGIGYHTAAWDIDTDRFLQVFARELRGNGGTIVTGARTESIRRDGDRWIVRAGGQDHAAAMLFNAAGAWAETVAAMAGIAAIGLQPYRRSMARIPAPGGHDVSGWPMIYGAGETWYCKPDAGCLIVSPADEEPVEPHDAWADDMVLAEGLARYEAAVTEPVTRVVANWAGLRTFAPDLALVLGPEPDCPSFFWVAGQGGYGFQSAVGASRFIADQVAGRASELDRDTRVALLPARFR